jgi:hypothetical protein
VPPCCGPKAHQPYWYVPSIFTLRFSLAQDFWMSAIGEPARMPPVLVYDNACQVVQLIQSTTDPVKKQQYSLWFGRSAIIVDRFHYSSHKNSSGQGLQRICADYCDPNKLEEMRSTDGRPLFNTSRNESANVWLGGFHSMVRGMTEINYHFFIDLMLLLKNDITAKELAKGGHQPTFGWYAMHADAHGRPQDMDVV